MKVGRREAEQQQQYAQDYPQQPYSPQAGGGYPAPGQEFQPGQPMYTPQAGYSPQPEFQAAGAAPGPQIHPDYTYQQAGYAPPDPNAYPQPAAPTNPYAAGAGATRRAADENVSAEHFRNAPDQSVHDPTPLYNSEGVPFYEAPAAERDGGSLLHS